MKKTAWDFGSDWEQPGSRLRRMEAAETTADTKVGYLGFRLVCAPGFQAYRGSSLEAVQPARGELPRSRSQVKVGIRLAVDWREK